MKDTLISALVCLNVVLLMGGVAVMVTGIVEGSSTVSSLKELMADADLPTFGFGATTLFFMGLFVPCVAMCGGTKCWTEHGTMTLCYWIIAFGFLAWELTVGGLAYAAIPEGDPFFEAELGLAWESTTNLTWRSDVQDLLGCCGFANATDLPGPGCGPRYISGCLGPVVDTLSQAHYVVAVSAGVLGILQVSLSGCEPRWLGLLL